MRRAGISTAGLAAGLGLLATMTAETVGQTPGAATIYEGARLIIGNGQVIEKGTLVVRNGKIAAVGRAGRVKAPKGATKVNVAGKTLMPALIDTHVHLSPSRDAMVRDLKRRAYFGVGAAMSLGQDQYANLSLRQENIPGAARFLSAGRGITMPEPGRITAPHWIQTAEEGRKVVQELAKNKVDIVKIWVDNRGGQFKKLTPEIYGAIIDEAHENKLRVTAHIFDLEDGRGLIKAGVDALAHGVRDKDIDDSFVAAFKAKRGLILTPNLPDRGVKADVAWLKTGLPAEEFAKLEAAQKDDKKAQEFFGIQARNLARLAKAGARITVGTDGNRPWGPHEEMEDMVVAGMTPAQVLIAATKNSAEFLRLNDMGTLAAGKSADFIVLDANPLDDIKNTRKISAVYLKGAAVDRSQPIR